MLQQTHGQLLIIQPVGQLHLLHGRFKIVDMSIVFMEHLVQTMHHSFT